MNNLIRSMPKRIDMVIRNKGKRIKYERNTDHYQQLAIGCYINLINKNT